MSKPIPPVMKNMSTSPHTMGSEQTIAAASKMMAEPKYGAAVVSDDGKVVGVFTTVDVCRTLAELFTTRLK